MIITPFAGFWSIHDFQNLISRDEELQIVTWDLPPREDWGIPERSIHFNDHTDQFKVSNKGVQGQKTTQNEFISLFILLLFICFFLLL